MRLSVIEHSTGKVLDVVSLLPGAGGFHFRTGAGRSIFLSKSDLLGGSKEAFKALNGYSNGYLDIRPSRLASQDRV